MYRIDKRFRLFAVISLMFGCIPSGYAVDEVPVQAHVYAGEYGQAFLMSRLGECYAITPAHVMGSEKYAILVGGNGDASQGDGDLLRTFGYDLSILRLSGALSRHCRGALSRVSNLNNLLTKNSSATVTSVNGDGSLSRREVTVNDVELLYVRVRPNGPKDQLFKGLSGSLLLVDDTPVGILMSVDSESGEGKALRYDRAIETLRPFFGMPARVAAKEPAARQSTTAEERVTIASWSSPPLDANSRAGNLIDKHGESVWYAKAAGFPIELIFELPGDRSRIVDSLVLIGEGVEPRERLPRDFEVLVSSSGQSRWIPVVSGTYFINDAEKRVGFMPMRARRVMLRLYSNWGDAQAVGLSGLELPLAK